MAIIILSHYLSRGVLEKLSIFFLHVKHSLVLAQFAQWFNAVFVLIIPFFEQIKCYFRAIVAIAASISDRKKLEREICLEAISALWMLSQL